MAKRKSTRTKTEPREVHSPPAQTLLSEIDSAMAGEFFDDLSNDSPYVKMAAEGFAGSGKTYTLAQICVGLYKHIGSKKPVVLFDTENSAKFMRPYFADKGITVSLKKSRTLADLRKSMEFCRNGYADILFIDSLTHIWQKFLEDYQRETKSKFLSMKDWGIVKPIWREYFTEPFVDDRYHAFFTGRAGYEFESEIDEKTGKREFFKAGIKMKTEGETAYEPDILLLMSRYEETVNPKKPKKIWREATVIKSRYSPLDGKTFKNPTYEDFKPAVDWILENAVDPAAAKRSYANTDLIEIDDERRAYLREKKIKLEEIEAFGHKHFGSAQAKDDKRNKILMMEHAFGTASWTRIQDLSVKDLTAGYKAMEEFMKKLEAEKSKAPADGNGKPEDKIATSPFEKHKRAIETAGNALAIKKAADAIDLDFSIGEIDKPEYAALQLLITDAVK